MQEKYDAEQLAGLVAAGAARGPQHLRERVGGPARHVPEAHVPPSRPSPRLCTKLQT